MTDREEPKRSVFKQTAIFLKHPLSAAILTFFFTVIGAGLFNRVLESISKKRDLELAATRQAIDSLKSITDLLFERTFRANMIKSSIVRKAPDDEIKERKKAYDEVFIRYNSSIQSNLFRVREMFGSSSYTKFESILEGPVRNLLVIQDDCITNHYDNALNGHKDDFIIIKNDLLGCKFADKNYKYTTIYRSVVHCVYTYTDSLYRIVRQNRGELVSVDDLKNDVVKSCELPPPDGELKHP